MKAYTYNDRLVGVGNDQILGTDQGGGSTYTAGNGIDITNDVISVDNTVALVSALPTTELGKFTIQNNVSGGPIDVMIPTDTGKEIIILEKDNNNVSGYETTQSGNSTYYWMSLKSPGYDNNYWSATAGMTLTIKFNQSIPANCGIICYYGTNSASSPSAATGPGLIQGNSYTVNMPSDKFTFNLVTNPVPEQYGGYGKWLTFQIAKSNDITLPSNIWETASIIINNYDISLGYTVNLDRYYLNNNVITSTFSRVQADVYTDPSSKKQTVYLPARAPYDWGPNIIFGYGWTNLSDRMVNGAYYNYYSYKYLDGNTSNETQFARCIYHHADNNINYFVYESFNQLTGNRELWTLDATDRTNCVWSTIVAPYATEVELQAVSGAIPTIQLNGNDQVTAIDGHALAGGSGGTEYTAGQYISIDSNDVISVTGLAPVSAIPDVSDMATKTWVGNQGYLTSVPEGYATDIEVSQAIASSIVQSDWAVTAVDSPAYIDNKPETLEMEISPVTGGNCISITEGNAGSIDWITTAGITDIVSVTALPANPVATVIYLIPET